MSNTPASEIRINNKKVEATINLQKVTRGVEDSSGGVQEEVIYDVSKVKHSTWFVLDLETGSRGWYPGKSD